MMRSSVWCTVAWSLPWARILRLRWGNKAVSMAAAGKNLGTWLDALDAFHVDHHMLKFPLILWVSQKSPRDSQGFLSIQGRNWHFLRFFRCPHQCVRALVVSLPVGSEVSHDSCFANLLVVPRMTSPTWWKIDMLYYIIWKYDLYVWEVSRYDPRIYNSGLRWLSFEDGTRVSWEITCSVCWGLVYLVELSTTPETARETQWGKPDIELSGGCRRHRDEVDMIWYACTHLVCKLRHSKAAHDEDTVQNWSMRPWTTRAGSHCAHSLCHYHSLTDTSRI